MRTNDTAIILASQSEGRKRLLKMLKIPFFIIPGDLDEDKIIGKTPLSTLKLRSRKKAEDTYKKVKNSNREIQSKLKIKTSRFLIISADSGAILGNKLIGKPKNYQDAVRILNSLSGKTHTYVTNIYAILVEQKTSEAFRAVKKWDIKEVTKVSFKKLSPQIIKTHLKLSKYTNYAGGYALFASTQDFIAKTEGSLSNLIGFPLDKIILILSEAEIIRLIKS